GSMRGTAVRRLESFKERYSSLAADHAGFTLTYQACREEDKCLLTSALGISSEAAGAGELRLTLTKMVITATGTLAA
ncbi:Calx-beta domain-containing protein, partial [Methylococcus sp. S1B]